MRQDKKQKQNSGVKDRIAQDAQLSWAVLSFHAILLALHLYGHVRFIFMPVLFSTLLKFEQFVSLCGQFVN